jgi:hypothetical protein
MENLMKIPDSRLKIALLLLILGVSILQATAAQSNGLVAVSGSSCTDGCNLAYQGCVEGAAGDPDILAVCEAEKTSCVSACPVGEPSNVLIYVDNPDSSKPGQKVNVHVKVSGDDGTPTGTVTITGASTTCSFTLNPAGIGKCAVEFYRSGLYVLTATYSGDSVFSSGVDTEDHTVK